MAIIKFLRLPKKKGGSAYQAISKFGAIMRPFFRLILNNSAKNLTDVGAQTIKSGADMLTQSFLNKVKNKIGSGKASRKKTRKKKVVGGGPQKRPIKKQRKKKTKKNKTFSVFD